MGSAGGSGGGVSGAAYFRSLAELGGGARGEDGGEFASYSPAEMLGSGAGSKSSRRTFVKLAGASMGLAGLTLTGCRRWPAEELAPYSSAPRERVPGVPEHYASAFELGGVAEGVIVTTYDGRPIKVEGNPDHPMSVAYAGGEGGRGRYGAAGLFAQASVLEMYDPERARGVSEGKAEGRKGATWEAFAGAAKAALASGPVAFLSTATSSPSVMAAWKALAGGNANAKWHEYEPLSGDLEREGTKAAFGAEVRPVLDLTKAKVVVSVDADILGHHPAHVRYSADWASMRRAEGGAMSRVYVAETTFTNTGAVADHRAGVRPSEVDGIIRALAAAVGVAGAVGGAGEASVSAEGKSWVAMAAGDLKAAGNAGVVAVGCHLSPATQAVGHLINAHLGAIGTTVKYVALPAKAMSDWASISQLAADLKSKALKGVIVMGGNPAYDGPVDLGLGELIKDAGFSAYHGLYENETSRLCGWHVPEAHYLESWGDARGYDGTVSLLQPMIEPLFGGTTKAELLAMLGGDEVARGLGGMVAEPTTRPEGKGAEREEAMVVAARAQSLGRAIARHANAFASEDAYKGALQKGIVEGTGYATVAVGGAGGSTKPAFPAAPAPEMATGGGMEFRFVCSNLYDGRFANLGWLVELPDGMTKLTWDNPLLVSKTDANKWGADNGDLVKVTIGGNTLEIPIFVLPGQPVGVAQLVLGWGRTAAGVVGTATGFDTYKLRATTGMWSASGSVAKGAGSYPLASTQEHYLTDFVGKMGYDVRIGGLHESGRIVREATLAEFRANPGVIRPESKGLALQLFDAPKSLVAKDAAGDGPNPRVNPHAWGMAIDMSACTGCGACVVACQAENNIPTVGKHQVLMQRAMHWIRIDRYFKTDRKADPDAQRPDVVFMPMMCQHCENAPCEQVCPVAATVHDTEGLNTMVYNRCIGTRYCSNNCPYKVRRFNYFDYHSTNPRGGLRAPWANIPDLQQRESIDAVRQLGFNPDVTVRMRGVMEKCTYCTQRIAREKIKVRNAHQNGLRDDEVIEDGAIMTACQQACSTQAIWFGDVADKGSRVLAWQASPRAYDVLEDLNTRPRTKYLGKLRNPGGEAVASATAGEKGNG